MVYHLNLKWKLLIVGLGAMSCLIGLVALISIVLSGQIYENIGPLIFIEFLFGFLGIELIYEGTKTKIEVFDDRIVYYQSRYTFSAQWSHLYQIAPSPSLLVLSFSKSEKISGGWVYRLVERMNMHTSLAINYYVTDENRALIREKIIKGLKIEDQNDIEALSQLI